MNSTNTLYCKVYVDGPVSKKELEELIRAGLGLRRIGRSWLGKDLEIDIRRNEDHSPERFAATWDDFVYSRFYFDLEPSEGAQEQPYIESVRELLELLRARGLRAFAACDFEDALPPNPFE